jgi:hypothetical protein
MQKTMNFEITRDRSHTPNNEEIGFFYVKFGKKDGYDNLVMYSCDNTKNARPMNNDDLFKVYAALSKLFARYTDAHEIEPWKQRIARISFNEIVDHYKKMADDGFIQTSVEEI